MSPILKPAAVALQASEGALDRPANSQAGPKYGVLLEIRFTVIFGGEWSIQPG